MNIDYKLKNLEDLWNNQKNKTKEPLCVFLHKESNLCIIEKNNLTIENYKNIKSRLSENYSIVEVNVINNSYLEEMFWEKR